MKKQLREVLDIAKELLGEIKMSHRYTLVDEEVIIIRNYLDSLINKSPEVKDLRMCKEFWDVGICRGRALAKELAPVKRSEIVDGVGLILQKIEGLSHERIFKIVESIEEEINACIHELRKSRKKRQRMGPKSTEPEMNPHRSATHEDMTRVPKDQLETSKGEGEQKYQSRRHPLPPIPRSR